ncbi:AMP-binding enzyme [Micromonospora yangpuensis]|uniref:AMP-binding enzyme n=1 Tax=Micromonospora yangpuensis TaxID=683228 RepID=UPI000B8A4ACA|nr:hypothetical protein [Micromonospora yangpuensis]GGL94000.1 hypothetical protein GCM10012279_09470 [Micromonospora yangpuensis]
MIRRSGKNIAAAEVEHVLMEHPRVRLAAVVGVPDDLRGEEIRAYVVRARDCTRCSLYRRWATPDATADACATYSAPVYPPKTQPIIDNK